MKGRLTRPAMTNTLDRKDILDQYKARLALFEGKKDFFEARGRRISQARLVTFLAAATGIVGGLGQFLSPWQWVTGLGVGFLAVFIALVVWHNRVIKTHRRFELLCDINHAAIKRAERDWTAFPLKRVSSQTSGHPLAFDLDLFSTTEGTASLFQLLGTTQTEVGKKTLEDWILNGALNEDIVMRQQAVLELTPGLEWRQELEFEGRLLPTPAPDIELFLEWAVGSLWLSPRKNILWASRVLGALPSVLLGLYLAGVLPQYWILAALFNLAFFAIFQKRCHGNFEKVSAREHAFGRFANLFELLSARTFESDYLKALKSRLSADNLSAFEQMRRLDRLVGMADARLSPMLYIPLQAMFLFSFHVWHGLERWQHRAGRHVRRWFDAMGDIEALSALADLHHNHPSWVFPTLDNTDISEVRATGLGHPLMHPNDCVTNDITIGPASTFQMITGSNMSGKSTLLRAIGLNVVLAQAGGPVFATSLTMPPLLLATSFRIQDSLQAGVSFFMAELRRLKEIVDLADTCCQKRPQKLLYLLDEILQGTNVKERQIAVRRVVLHLLEKQAIGAISTHDLSLADQEGLADRCEAHHFVESYTNGKDGPSMNFDYILRPGIAPTVNALKLLEIVGLTED